MKPLDIKKPRKYHSEKLSISEDYDIDPNKTYPVLFIKPNPDDFNHYHVCLTKKEAEKLRDWLNGWLDQVDGWKKTRDICS